MCRYDKREQHSVRLRNGAEGSTEPGEVIRLVARRKAESTGRV
jgi:hypothetical protein